VPIPDHLVEQVRQQADLVEIVSEHTRLKRSGRTFRGPCPLHGGEGNNFSVDPAKGYYKCFVCGEGGTVYTFLMKHLGMSYPEAIRSVAERVGIEIPDERAHRQEVDPDQPLYEVNAFAADWFRKRLWDDERGRRRASTWNGAASPARRRSASGWGGRPRSGWPWARPRASTASTTGACWRSVSPRSRRTGATRTTPSARASSSPSRT
jgi:DNA primase